MGSSELRIRKGRKRRKRSRPPTPVSAHEVTKTSFGPCVFPWGELCLRIVRGNQISGERDIPGGSESLRVVPRSTDPGTRSQSRATLGPPRRADRDHRAVRRLISSPPPLPRRRGILVRFQSLPHHFAKTPSHFFALWAKLVCVTPPRNQGEICHPVRSSVANSDCTGCPIRTPRSGSFPLDIWGVSRNGVFSEKWDFEIPFF